MLACNADVNSEDNYNKTSLHEAVGRGNFDVAQLLPSYGADLNPPDHEGVPPLHKASRSRKSNFVELPIIVRTLTPEATTIQRHFMKPLLHEASSSGNLNIAKLLLNNGADVNALDDRVESPLYKASQSWQFDVALLLLKSGADVNTRHFTKLRQLELSTSLDCCSSLVRT